MTALLLRIGPGSGYEDGDILCAFNRRRIRHCHAEMVCWPRQNGRKVGGHLVNAFPLLQLYFETIYQYKFERVSRAEVLRTDLTTGETALCSKASKDSSTYMDVEEYIERRKKAGKKPLFGPEGREIWYGGKSDLSETVAAKLWTDIIPANSPHRETGCPACQLNHEIWPAGLQELKSHLFLPVSDFDDTEAEALVEPVYDLTKPDEPVIVKKRRHRASWDVAGVLAKLGVSPKLVRDRSVPIDVREKPPVEDILPVFDKHLGKQRPIKPRMPRMPRMV